MKCLRNVFPPPLPTPQPPVPAPLHTLKHMDTQNTHLFYILHTHLVMSKGRDKGHPEIMLPDVGFRNLKLLAVVLNMTHYKHHLLPSHDHVRCFRQSLYRIATDPCGLIGCTVNDECGVAPFKATRFTLWPFDTFSSHSSTYHWCIYFIMCPHKDLKVCVCMWESEHACTNNFFCVEILESKCVGYYAQQNCQVCLNRWKVIVATHCENTL